MDEVSVFLTVEEANAVETVLGNTYLGFDMKDHDIYNALQVALRDFGGYVPFKFDRTGFLRPPEHTPQLITNQSELLAAFGGGGGTTNGSTVIIQRIDYGDMTTSNSSIVRDIKA